MKSKEKEYRAEYWRQYRAEKKPYSVKICCECGVEFSNQGGAAKRCKDCRYVTCSYCGKRYRPPDGKYTRKYCNRSCKDLSQKGREPEQLKQNRGVKPRTYHITNRDKHGSAMDRDWRSAVFLRDDYTCQACGVQGGRLQAHHIKSWKTNPELRHDVNNGLTLCKDCHKKTDNYGGKNKAKRLAQEVLPL